MVVFGVFLSDTFNFLLTTHPLLVIAAFIFIEELGVPSPVPGDLMMLLAGVEVAQHRQHLWVVLLVQMLATVAGASGLFAFSRRVGRPFVVRYGHFIHLTPERLARVEAPVRKHGGRAVVAGRLIPGLRILTPIVAGVLGEPFLVFLPALTIGGFLYILALTLVGVFIGPAALDTFERLSLPVEALCSFAALGVLLFVVRKARGALREERGLSLGVIAGVAALLATNGIIGLLRFGSRVFGGGSRARVNGRGQRLAAAARLAHLPLRGEHHRRLLPCLRLASLARPGPHRAARRAAAHADSARALSAPRRRWHPPVPASRCGAVRR